MWPKDPPRPGHPAVPDERDDLFAINLGVYVPEVAQHHIGPVKSWIQDYHCCVRARLNELTGQGADVWWHAHAGVALVPGLQRDLEEVGLPFLERFGTRDRILVEWDGVSENMGVSSPPRIVSAIILVARGDREQARRLLSQQVWETRKPGHPGYVRRLAERLGLGTLEGPV